MDLKISSTKKKDVGGGSLGVNTDCGRDSRASEEKGQVAQIAGV